MPLDGGLVSLVRRLRDRELIGRSEVHVRWALMDRPTTAVRVSGNGTAQSVDASSALQSWNDPPS